MGKWQTIRFWLKYNIWRMTRDFRRPWAHVLLITGGQPGGKGDTMSLHGPLRVLALRGSAGSDRFDVWHPSPSRWVDRGTSRRQYSQAHYGVHQDGIKMDRIQTSLSLAKKITDPRRKKPYHRDYWPVMHKKGDRQNTIRHFTSTKAVDTPHVDFLSVRSWLHQYLRGPASRTLGCVMVPWICSIHQLSRSGGSCGNLE